MLVLVGGSKDVLNVNFALLNRLHQYLPLVLVVLEPIKVLLKDTVTDGLNGEHLGLKVFEFFACVHDLIRDELIRLIDLSQKLL